MTGLEKVAVLLRSLPAPAVEKVLRHMDARHASLIAAELEKLKKDGTFDAQLKIVLQEAAAIFEAASRRKPESAPPSAAPQREVDIRVEDAPAKKPQPAVNSDHADPLQALVSLDSGLLAQALESENGRTISLLINTLEVGAAGEIYKRLSSAKRKEVSMRFTEAPIVNSELVKRVAQGLVQKCRALRDSQTASPTEPGAKERRVAALLRGLERADRTEALAVLEQSDAELTARVKAMLYQFEDILRMENASVQKLLSEVDVKSLAQALRGADAQIETKVLSNLSKRAQESLKEEVELNGNLPSAKVKAARQTLVDALQRLDERGELVFME